MAHRGASDLAPENGATAFALAVEHGADLIETDLWCTADDEIVCHHDPTLLRMTGDVRRVDQVRFAELSRLRLRVGRDPTVGREAGDRVPTLAELVAMVPEHVVLVLEIKDTTFREPRRIDRLLDVLGPRARELRAGVIGEDLGLLMAIKQRAPGLATGHISMANPFGHGRTELLGPFWPLLYLNPLYVRHAHRRGQRVCPLDPDLHRRLGRYLDLDVDAVLTNDPRETRTRLDALRRRMRDRLD